MKYKAKPFPNESYKHCKCCNTNSQAKGVSFDITRPCPWFNTAMSFPVHPTVNG